VPAGISRLEALRFPCKAALLRGTDPRVHVRFDDGTTLGLVADEDAFELIQPERRESEG